MLISLDWFSIDKIKLGKKTLLDLKLSKILVKKEQVLHNLDEMHI